MSVDTKELREAIEAAINALEWEPTGPMRVKHADVLRAFLDSGLTDREMQIDAKRLDDAVARLREAVEDVAQANRVAQIYMTNAALHSSLTNSERETVAKVHEFLVWLGTEESGCCWMPGHADEGTRRYNEATAALARIAEKKP